LTLRKAQSRSPRNIHYTRRTPSEFLLQETIMYKRILVPTDGSEITGKAIVTAIGLAKLTGASVEAIAVKEPFPYSAISEMQPTPPQEFYEAQERIATQRVQAVVKSCQDVGVACNAVTVEALHPWEAILEQAKRSGCDLIVMASHGRRGMSAVLLGSETHRVLTHSTLPVMVVR
jgi:nucleotide-binding universal stress UspA family protein